MKRNLTDAFIRSIRAPAGGRLELNDAACRGLALRITPNDIRTWNYRYTAPTGGVGRMAIGRYPAIGLADARLRADALGAARRSGAVARCKAGRGAALRDAVRGGAKRGVAEIIPCAASPVLRRHFDIHRANDR